MKKLLSLVAILFLSTALLAQSEVVKLSKKESDKNMAAIQDVPALQNQLVAKCGENYDLTNAEVMSMLKTNITNKKLSYEVRKMSLYAYYGDENENHANELGNPRK